MWEEGRPESAAGFAEMAPDLAIEVLSPGDRPGDVLAKVADWLGVARVRALRHYESFVATLRRELEAAPAAETVALAERLRTAR